MRKWKRVASLAMAGALAAGMLAGCGGNSGSQETAGGGQAQGTSAEGGSDSGEQITLRFSWWGGDDRHEATLEAIKLFEEKYPNIKISPEYSGFDGYQSKLSASLAGGQEADIMQIDQPWMGTFL